MVMNEEVEEDAPVGCTWMVMMMLMNEDDDDDDIYIHIYIMMQCLSVCLSRKMITFLKGLSVNHEK